MTGYARPRTLDEALALRRAHPDWTLLAGGTDVMVRPPETPGVIDLFGLAELRGVSAEGDALRIGAATTCTDLLESAPVERELPALRAAAAEVGAWQIQNRGTLGGNVGTSSPAGDFLPVLLALDATVELRSASASRSVPYAAFCTGYRRTALAPDELIVALRVPRPAPGTRQFWRKVGTRLAQAISKVMVAAAARTDGDGRLAHVRIGLGSVADRPVRARALEQALHGARPASLPRERVAALLDADVAPIDDVRSTAAYRRAVAANLVARFLSTL